MTDAAPESIFVWCNHSLSYPRDLAKSCERGDLEIVSPDRFKNWRQFQGRDLTGIVIDHAAYMDEELWAAYHYLMPYVRKKALANP